MKEASSWESQAALKCETWGPLPIRNTDELQKGAIGF